MRLIVQQLDEERGGGCGGKGSNVSYAPTSYLFISRCANDNVTFVHSRDTAILMPKSTRNSAFCPTRWQKSDQKMRSFACSFVHQTAKSDPTAPTFLDITLYYGQEAEIHTGQCILDL